jgi:hypothetical protein
MATVKPDISPAALLGRFRGRVTHARVTYPERAAIDVVDGGGGEWHLTTWWADYSPADPAWCEGKTVVSARIDGPAENLTIGFSDGTSFTITPVWDGGDDAIENWELFAPDNLVLTCGPRGRWQTIGAGGIR